MKAVVLAATHDTRLNADGNPMPLPLVDLVRGEPYLTTLVKLLTTISGLSSVYVVTNVKLYPLLIDWAQQITKVSPIPVFIVNDRTEAREDQLGAIGDLRFTIAEHQLDDDLLVIGGENWVSMPLELFCIQASHSSPAVLVTQVKVGVKPSRYGWAQLGAGGRIKRFIEHAADVDSGPELLKASCIYFLAKADVSLLDRFAEEQDVRCTPGAFFAWLVNSGQPVYGLRFDGVWYDVGGGKRPRGGEWLELREVLRHRVDAANATWERRAARGLQWVSSHEDLIEALGDHDINRSIVAADLLGHIGHLLSSEGRQQVIEALTKFVNDLRVNDISDSPFQMDEDDPPVALGKTAAASIATLYRSVN